MKKVWKWEPPLRSEMETEAQVCEKLIAAVRTYLEGLHHILNSTGSFEQSGITMAKDIATLFNAAVLAEADLNHASARGRLYVLIASIFTGEGGGI